MTLLARSLGEHAQWSEKSQSSDNERISPGDTMGMEEWNNYEDFIILIKHITEENRVLYSIITLKIDDIVIKLSNQTVIVEGEIVELPYSISSIMIHRIGVDIQISSSIGLMFKKYDDGSFELHLDGKYANQTCGLCGDLMGESVFHTNGFPLTETEFGNLQKADGPNEDCPDANPPDWSLIYDDVFNGDCMQVEDCPCTYNGNVYQPGESYSTSCRTCTCYSAKWNCTVIPCSSTCSIEGGSHITTFDYLSYNVHGDCIYVVSKDYEQSRFTILGELRPCGIRQEETCLKGVTIYLNSGTTKLEIKPNGFVYLNGIHTGLPLYSVSEKYIIFQPSPFYIVMNSMQFGLQVVVEILPIMQLYVVLDPVFGSQTQGLCGNFNNAQNDDFMTISGIIEGTAAAFVNTWKLTSDCPNIQDVFDDPCSLNIESAAYAKHWCGLLINETGVFSPCHYLVDPEIYYKHCLMDTCSCEKSEACMCAALFSYSKICAAKGVILNNWHTAACSSYSTYCSQTQTYSYHISSCIPTCRSLSEPDILCKIHFDPLIGCTCMPGFYLNDSGVCIPAQSCPCYYRGTEVPPGQSITENGVICFGIKHLILFNHFPECKDPKMFVNCSIPGDTGIECAKSCETLDMECYATRCIPGCVCPPGLVSNDKGVCITENSCPCIHNGISYSTGAEIKVRCNTCVCENRRWECTNYPCLATCTVYGNGHVITFDGKRYIFNGECQYVLSQDHCSLNDNNSTFSIITENVPCGTTGMTCSKSIKFFIFDYEIILMEEHLNVVQRGADHKVPYRVRLTGIYLVVETTIGLVLIWDRKTSIFIKVTVNFQGKLCGLCGNYDGNANNDFTTRNNAIVENVEEFGNSWKSTSTCPDAKIHRDPCSFNPYRLPWAQKQCSIISSDVFSACHPYVDPFDYYDACVTDSCACNTGGDCECLCTAVAAYAQACGEFGICISWRTPSICPLFCDYYNGDNGCEWHYRPCGAPCLKTCRNKSGNCSYVIGGLEGCYPKCPPERPYFDEDEMTCVEICGCYDEDRKHYPVGAIVPSQENCQICIDNHHFNTYYHALYNTNYTYKYPNYNTDYYNKHNNYNTDYTYYNLSRNL
ncbi:mucin-5B-like [Eleutherodactylus coqui]|uniref:mucin-5B-like n=1 Tax=Eleutherodactylus coqui TaxID=57060 RepID=UPI003462436D